MRIIPRYKRIRIAQFVGRGYVKRVLISRLDLKIGVNSVLGMRGGVKDNGGW